MNIAGQLIAEGNAVYPIRFLSTDTAGWAGLRFQPSAQNSRCTGCYLENLMTGTVALQVEAPITFKKGLVRDVPEGMAISSTVPFTLSNVVIDYVGTGLHFSGSLTTTHTASHLTVSRCHQGIVNQGQHVSLANSILTTCDMAVSTELSGTTAVSYTLFNGNGEDFVTGAGAQLIQGTGLITAAPGFIDFPNNFHLQADSPAVNAADPLADYSHELGYNGGRADLGAYGNTWQAPERSPLDQMAVTLTATTPVQTGQPGQTISYTLTLKNSGIVTDNYRVGLKSLGDGFRTSLYPDGDTNTPSLYTHDLAPQEQISLTVRVVIPTTLPLSPTQTISVTTIGDYGIQATVELTTEVMSFQEIGGQLVMEAEHFAKQVEHGGRRWLTQTVLVDYAGLSYLSALPDTDRQFTTAYTTTSPELQYTFYVTTTGVYTIWLRGYAPNGTGDSVYLGLDDQVPVTPAILTGFAPGKWSWANSNPQGGKVTLAITQLGFHTLRLWQREDGLRLDRIVLTTDDNYNPSGDGPPESEIR